AEIRCETGRCPSGAARRVLLGLAPSGLLQVLPEEASGGTASLVHPARSAPAALRTRARERTTAITARATHRSPWQVSRREQTPPQRPRTVATGSRARKQMRRISPLPPPLAPGAPSSLARRSRTRALGAGRQRPVAPSRCTVLGDGLSSEPSARGST